MKVTIDITEDASTSDPLEMPTPTSFDLEGDDVVFALREAEIRMTMGQVLSLHAALGRWIFRDFRGVVDPNDPDWCADFEHEKLRTILTEMVNGTIADREIPKPIVDEIRWELARQRVPIETWRSKQEQVRELNDEITHLKSEVAEVREQLAIAKRPKRAPKGV